MVYKEYRSCKTLLPQSFPCSSCWPAAPPALTRRNPQYPELPPAAITSRQPSLRSPFPSALPLLTTPPYHWNYLQFFIFVWYITYRIHAITDYKPIYFVGKSKTKFHLKRDLVLCNLCLVSYVLGLWQWLWYLMYDNMTTLTSKFTRIALWITIKLDFHLVWMKKKLTEWWWWKLPNYKKKIAV